MRPPADTETAVRDPKRIRRTVWILVIIMIAGGWLVLQAYESWAAEQARDTRPALIHRIRKERDLRLMRQDGRQAELFELRGRVLIVNCLSCENPQAAARSMAVMQRLSDKWAGEEDLRLVTLLVDAVPAEKLRNTLERTATTHGMALPQWWLGATEPETMHRFIKNELKSPDFPNRSGGTWHYDSSLVLIDRNGHLRRAVVPKTRNGKPSRPAVVVFDFDLAAQWDAEGRSTGTGRSNEAEMEDLLNATLRTLIAEKAEQP
jgi:hypothetical protein